ncbi:MAG: 6-phosphofructokinase, partial [Clostridiales bacterium]|nr:6-phosphofructokinase [Clostridiales bacterium]
QVEAYAVGKKAVEAALAGETDYMVAIDAHRGETYSFDLFLTPLSKVANVEKKFPLEWILDGNRIDDRFFGYAMPLMMDRAPDYAILR